MTDWIEAVTRKVDSELTRVFWPDDVQRPAASVLVYSVARREIFRVGDCHYLIDGVDHQGGKEIDELLDEDLGRDLILDGLSNQYKHANP